MKNTLVVLAGAVVGGVLGYNAFFWILSQGLYGLVLPGGLLGLGAGIGKNRSMALAVACGLAATMLGLFTEWKAYPFDADDSLSYFLRHVADLQPWTLLMVALGGAIGFWVPFRRIEKAQKTNHT